MQEERFNVLTYAMHYGVGLGFFWAFKYLFHIGATYYPDLDFIYQSLSIGTVFLLYYLTRRYRDKVHNGKISYWHCMSFSIQICFFASLIEAVVSYFHYTVIDPSYISSINKEMLAMMKGMNLSKEIIKQTEAMSFGPVYYTVTQIIGNVIFGFIFSLISGFIISKKINFNNNN